MEKVYRNFFRNFYLHTGGFVPTKLPGRNVYPGDFFQIRNGEIIVLGNIFLNGVIDTENCRFDYAKKLNPANWSFGDGVNKPYSGRESGHGTMGGEFEFSKQILAFAGSGSFLFRGHDPESVRIANWAELQQQLIIRLTQVYYSFRDLYLVTEVATTNGWTLVVGASDKAELEIATDTENFGLVDIFGHHSAKTIQSRDIEFYHQQTGRQPSFFRAKKLVVQEEPREVFISQLIASIQHREDWARSFFDYDFNTDHYDAAHHPPAYAQASVLDMLQANQLNPNTTLLYFRWSDISLDDVEKLFVNYGSS